VFFWSLLKKGVYELGLSIRKTFHVLLYGMCDGAQQRGGDCYLFDYTEKKQAMAWLALLALASLTQNLITNYLDLELFELNLIFPFCEKHLSRHLFIYTLLQKSPVVHYSSCLTCKQVQLNGYYYLEICCF